MNVIRGAGVHPVAFLGRRPVFLERIHHEAVRRHRHHHARLWRVHPPVRPARGPQGGREAPRGGRGRRAEVEAAAWRANEGEIEDVAPRLVKVVEADGDAAVDIFLGGYVE